MKENDPRRILPWENEDESKSDLLYRAPVAGYTEEQHEKLRAFVTRWLAAVVAMHEKGRDPTGLWERMLYQLAPEERWR